MMLDIPSQLMHYCLVLLCEVYCVIVQEITIIVVFFVTLLETCYSLGISRTSRMFIPVYRVLIHLANLRQRRN